VKETADVIVVGAGIVGASIAHELARHNGGRVIALDKGLGPSEGSTGASSSICRTRYTHPEVTRLAFYGVESFRNWDQYTGLASPRSTLHEIGVLWMLGQTMEKAQADAGRLGSLGVFASVLDPTALAERFPALSPCAAHFDRTGEVEHECRPGEAFLLEEGGGYVEPTGANQDLIDAARNLGAEIRFNSRVVGVRQTRGRANGVTLSDGSEIDAGLVMNASGPWCNQLNALAGVELRWTLTPTRIQTIYREWSSKLGPLPVTLDMASGIYFRPDVGDRQLLVGSVLPEDEEEVVKDPDDFKRTPDGDFRDLTMAVFHHRVPEATSRGRLSGICGLYTINREDVHPVVGPTELDGFWVANGFSGHGFKLAPGIGSMVAQAATGSTLAYDTEVPMSFFAADREPISVAVKHVLA
jgi:glycine/D-amino acid oxidase-like deaminating enzyme